MAFISRPDANHILFQRARRMLGLDVVGFDYAYDRVGRVVVWEANPFPDTNYPEDPRSRHIVPATQRTFAAMARLYLRRAGCDVPALLDDLLAEVPDDDAPQRDRFRLAA